jgi:hypothetical protein
VAYGDSTDYMAAGHKEIDWPRKCFNGYKNWQLGWYKDRQLTLNDAFDEGHIVPLASFVDFNRTDTDEPVVVIVADEFYIQFNLARDFNIDTEEKRNQVTITAPGASGSEGLAGLKENESYEVPNFQNTGKVLVIDVCTRHRGKLGAYAMWISIAFDKSLCDGVPEEQVKKEYNLEVEISNSPSIMPSKQPLSLRPTSLPTAKPTENPSKHPSFVSTGVPTSIPTMVVPTTQPSLIPTHIASQQPSILPSYDPTSEPSISPKNRITILTDAPSSGSISLSLPPMTAVPTPTPKINYKKLLEKREEELADYGSVKLNDLISLFNKGSNR